MRKIETPRPSHLGVNESGRFSDKFWQRPTLPGRCPPSTIGAGGLNCRVREGNGCIPAAMATRNLDYPEVNNRSGRDAEASALSHP